MKIEEYVIIRNGKIYVCTEGAIVALIKKINELEKEVAELKHQQVGKEEEVFWYDYGFSFRKKHSR